MKYIELETAGKIFHMQALIFLLLISERSHLLHLSISWEQYWDQQWDQLLEPALRPVLRVIHAPLLRRLLLSSMDPFYRKVTKAALLSHHFLVTGLLFHQGWKCPHCLKEDESIMERHSPLSRGEEEGDEKRIGRGSEENWKGDGRGRREEEEKKEEGREEEEIGRRKRTRKKRKRKKWGRRWKKRGREEKMKRKCSVGKAMRASQTMGWIFSLFSSTSRKKFRWLFLFSLFSLSLYSTS